VGTPVAYTDGMPQQHDDQGITRPADPLDDRQIDPASSLDEGTDDATLPSGEAIAHEIRELLDYSRAERTGRHPEKDSKQDDE
jgi:hypothetical protein